MWRAETITVVIKRIGFVSVSIRLTSSISPPPPAREACLNESSRVPNNCHFQCEVGLKVTSRGRRLRKGDARVSHTSPHVKLANAHCGRVDERHLILEEPEVVGVGDWEHVAFALDRLQKRSRQSAQLQEETHVRFSAHL